MMNKLYTTLTIILILTCCFSCRYESEGVDRIFTGVENIVEQFPDSAQVLLDSINNPLTLSPQHYAEYILLSTQVKDKRYKDIAGDTLIFKARDYFRETNDVERLVLAKLYCGRVLQAQKKPHEAMKAYLEAQSDAANTENANTKGLIDYFIGRLNYDQSLYDDALGAFKNASINFSLANNVKNETGICTSIANTELIQGEVDSAFFYYNKGLKLAELHQDSASMVKIKRNMGVALYNLNDFSGAKKIILEANSLDVNPEGKERSYMTLARIYDKENKKDSVSYYINLLKESLTEDKNVATLAANYRLLSENAEKERDLLQALEYYKLYQKSYATFWDEKGHSEMLEIQKKYNYELVKSANNRLLIQRQWIVLLVITILLCTVIVFFLFYRKHTRNKEALSKAIQSIFQLKELANEAEKHGADSMHRVLVQRFYIIRKLSLLEGYLREDEKEQGQDLLKKVNKIIYDQDNFNWDTLYQSMNELNKGYFDEFRKHFPQLNESEFRICCLTKAGFNNTEISIIMRLTISTIQTKKTIIRRKLHISEHGDIAKLMDEKLDYYHSIHLTYKI